MASHIEMQRVAKDPEAIRSLAYRILRLDGASLTDWETDFLKGTASSNRSQPITLRWCEKLFEIKENNEYLSEYRRFSIELLIENCWLRRCDLNSEKDLEFIDRLRSSGTKTIKRKYLPRLLRCCRELEVIEAYV